MTKHKFSAGDTVSLSPSPHFPPTLGKFRIVRQMPTERGIAGYRIESLTDGHARVVTEAEIA